MDTHVIINLFHILIVAPFLLWVGISRGNLPEGVFIGLIVLGIIVALYHSFKAYRRIISGSGYAWVNLIHALWIGPLLLFIGAKKRVVHHGNHVDKGITHTDDVVLDALFIGESRDMGGEWMTAWHGCQR
jgi:hypothetical protein